MTTELYIQPIGALLLDAFHEIDRQSVTIEELFVYIIRRDGSCPYTLEEITAWFETGDWMKK